MTAVDDYRADIFVEDETVSLIGRNLTVSADRIIDATGKLVLPDGVDPHTHMEMPFSSGPCARRARRERSSACTLRTAS